MKILFLHFQFRVRDLLRQPTYIVTSLIFPSMFFWFFGVPNATTPAAAQLLMSSFSSFAILGVVLFQLSVSFSQERNSPWSLYLKTLPVQSWQILGSQLMTSLFFSFFAVGAVVCTAHLSLDVQLPQERWVPFLTSVFFGGIPFASLGLLLGTICNPQTVVPVSNLVYLPLSFAGGLWLPPVALPKIIQNISDYLPTRMYAEVVWAGALKQELKSENLVGLIIYSFLFLIAAIYFYKKDEGTRFG